jgi:hypothetical protein
MSAQEREFLQKFNGSYERGAGAFRNDRSEPAATSSTRARLRTYPRPVKDQVSFLISPLEYQGRHGR